LYRGFVNNLLTSVEIQCTPKHKQVPISFKNLISFIEGYYKSTFFAKLGTQGAPENLIPFATPIEVRDPLG